MIHIACAADNKYVQHTVVMLTSLFENNKENIIHLHFFSADFSTENKNKVAQTVLKYQQHFSFYPLDASLFKDCYVSNHVSFATYYRIVIPNILFKITNRVLYLDTDIVVCKNLKPLWDINIDNYTIAAVNELNFDGPERLNFDTKYMYFNAGILLINAEVWFLDNLQETLFEYIKENTNKLIFWDQDALNANLYNKRLTIEPKWNQLSPVFEVNDKTLLKVYSKSQISELKKNPAIIHYSGSSKPWDYLNIHPFKEVYYKYLALTEWKNYKPKSNLNVKIKFVLLVLLGRNFYSLFFKLFNF
ncbi:MAG: glycosyltransferase family 8 protein [Bacteroidia bacterium]|nr:glycosyltransferase family 8 protein [Bacteroidia bacterium]